MIYRLSIAAALGLTCLWQLSARSADDDAAERGRRALLERSFTPATLTVRSYPEAWRQWGDGRQEPPADYTAAFRQRYGLHEAPYPNDGYPMGLRKGTGLLGFAGLSTDCLICHGGSILGQSIIGLGNSTLDFQALIEEMAAADGWKHRSSFTSCNVRGTSEAGAFSVYLLSLREPDLSLRSKRLDLGLHDNMCEDTPAWWLLKKKKTMYHSGAGDARSVRTLMQFMLSPLNSAETIQKKEGTFRDIRAYLLSLQPPRYPLPIDQELANKGQQVFALTCAGCHGTYGEKWTYPNKIIPLDDIGTDRKHYEGFTREFVIHYAKTWFAREKQGWLADDYTPHWTNGYQAPPLDGIWATAPYFHNGSAPTVYHVLNSQARPKIFTRSFRTDREAYDAERLGWKVQVLDRGPDPTLPAIERRKVYDTTQPGRSNGGHTYGDDLTDAERMAVIEYLKTL
jgi:mono/diheme cytochrome c family protein